MRKSIFLTLVLSLCMADFGAFAATVRNVRGSGSATTSTTQETQSAPVAARAGARQKVVTSPTNNTSVSAAPVAARAGARQKVVSAPVQNTTTNAAKTSGTVAARSATKKALAMGTKVATATENTAVDQECQNAYYGCMDAFCMLDNAAGGRCQCSDRVTELDAVLAEIMKIDEQSVRIATEGVETVQMGEFADQINAKAKAIESGIDGSKTTNQKTATTSLSKYTSAGAFSSSVPNLVDLSSLSNSSLFDDGTEDDFGATANTITNEVIEDIANRKGDDLQKAAAKACVAQIPAQCKSSSALLQMAYVQRVRSDCVGYENALKQQRSASQQKLLTAQKAVRDAVLNEVKEQNKYTTQGECVAEFDKCMQTNGGCGSDYSNCVADDTVLTMGADGKSTGTAKQASIKTSASKIGISANTLAMLTDKAPICEIVLKQCQNVRDGVWDAYLKMIAPTLKSQEVLAEENRRMNCVGNIVNCFSKACAAKWPNQESAEYDMCLANPEIVQNLCQTQITKCSTSGTGDKVMEYVKAKLGAMRVDACTAQVKACLLDEDRCGKDYTKCVGLDTETIGNICPADKLVACTEGEKYSKDNLRAYVAEIGQGLALNIDSSFYTQCQKAANDAITKLCGAEDSCDKIAETKIMVENPLSVVFKCKKADTGKEEEFTDLNLPTDDEAKTCRVEIAGKINVEKMNFKESNLATITGEGGEETARNLFELDDGAETNDFLTRAKDKLNSSFDLYYSQAASDQTVKYCTEGRSVQGFDKTNNFGDATKAKERFPNLLNSLQILIGEQLLDNFYNEYYEKLAAAETERQNQIQALSKRLLEIAEKEAAEKERAIDIKNDAACHSAYDKAANFQIRGNGEDKTQAHIAEYDPETNMCKETIHMYNCRDFKKRGIKHRRGCLRWHSTPSTTTVVQHTCNEGSCK